MQSPTTLQKSCRASKSGLRSRAPPPPSEDCSRNSCLRSLPALHTAADNDCRSCNTSPVLRENRNSLPLVGSSTSFDVIRFARKHCFEIFRVRYQQVTSPTSSRVSSVSHEQSRKDFCTELMHSTLDFLQLWDRILHFCRRRNHRPSNGELKKRSKEVWPGAGYLGESY